MACFLASPGVRPLCSSVTRVPPRTVDWWGGRAMLMHVKALGGHDLDAGAEAA